MKMILFISLAFLWSCAYVRTPLTGFLYSDVKSGIAISSNSAPTLNGAACSRSYLGLMATGDSSIETARLNGNIKKISYVDQRGTSYLGFYAKHCTYVRGN